MTVEAQEPKQYEVLMALGKNKGYLTHMELQEHLSEDAIDEEMLEFFQEQGVEIYESDAAAQASQSVDVPTDGDDNEPKVNTGVRVEDRAGEIEVSSTPPLSAESEAGRATEITRMYMKEQLIYFLLPNIYTYFLNTSNKFLSLCLFRHFCHQ